MTTVAPITPGHPAFDRVAELFDGYRVHYGQPPDPERTRTWLREQITQGGLVVAAAGSSGLITATVMPASLTLGTVWSIRDLYVAPGHRRGGVARALVAHIVARARAAGARRVSLQTETGNVPALALYTGLGFRPVTGLELLNLTFEPSGPRP